MNTTESSPPNSVASLLRELRDETTTLLRQEVSLAKTELKANTARLGAHVAQIAIGGFVAYAGVIVLLIGLGQLLGRLLVRFGMSENLAQWSAPTVLGLAVALLGWSMVARAKRALSHDEITPRQTIASLHDDKAWAQRKLQHSP